MEGSEVEEEGSDLRQADLEQSVSSKTELLYDRGSRENFCNPFTSEKEFNSCDVRSEFIRVRRLGYHHWETWNPLLKLVYTVLRAITLTRTSRFQNLYFTGESHLIVP